MKKLLYPFIFISLLLVSIMILRFLQTKPSQSEIKEQSIPVNTIEADVASFSPEFGFYGNIIGKNEIDIISTVSGQVKVASEKLFNGIKVKEGEILFEIDPSDYREKVIEKEATLNDLKSEMNKTLFMIKEAETQYQISNKNYSRKKKLLGNTVSKKALEDAELNLSLAKTNLSKEKFRAESLRAKINKAKSKLNVSKKDLSNTRYRAPFNGRIFDNKIDKGIEITRGDKLAKLVNTDKLEVKFFVGESSFTKLGSIDNIIGKKIRILWNKSDYKKKYLGIITKIDGVISKELAGLHMYAELEELDNADPIRPGVFVEILVEGPLIQKTFLIPENAVYEEKYIYIIKNNKPLRISIELKGNIKNKKIAYGNITNNDTIIIDKLPNIEEIKNVYSIKN